MKGMEYRTDVAEVESDLLTRPDVFAKVCEDAAASSGSQVNRSAWAVVDGVLVLTVVLKGGLIVIQAFVDDGLLIMNIVTLGPEVDAFKIMDVILSRVGGRLTFRDSAGRFRDLSDQEGW